MQGVEVGSRRALLLQRVPRRAHSAGTLPTGRRAALPSGKRSLALALPAAEGPRTTQASRGPYRTLNSTPTPLVACPGPYQGNVYHVPGRPSDSGASS